MRGGVEGGKPEDRRECRSVGRSRVKVGRETKRQVPEGSLGGPGSREQDRAGISESKRERPGGAEAGF